MKTYLSKLLKRNFIKLLNVNEVNSFKINYDSSLRYLNIGGKASSSSTLLLSPAEASRILRTNESTVDVDTKCPIKYYDVNYLGSNNPPEDRQVQAKFLHSDIYLFGVFDGHGGHYCSVIEKKKDQFLPLNLINFFFNLRTQLINVYSIISL
jgi:hypothetical protein